MIDNLKNKTSKVIYFNLFHREFVFKDTPTTLFHFPYKNAFCDVSFIIKSYFLSNFNPKNFQTASILNTSASLKPNWTERLWQEPWLATIQTLPIEYFPTLFFVFWDFYERPILIVTVCYVLVDKTLWCVAPKSTENHRSAHNKLNELFFSLFSILHPVGEIKKWE